MTLNKNKAIGITIKRTQDEKVLPDEENDDYEIEKDILGNCRLILKKASQSQTGKYACRIKGREKEKNCYTKTEVVVQGRLFLRVQLLYNRIVSVRPYVSLYYMIHFNFSPSNTNFKVKQK